MFRVSNILIVCVCFAFVCHSTLHESFHKKSEIENLFSINFLSPLNTTIVTEELVLKVEVIGENISMNINLSNFIICIYEIIDSNKLYNASDSGTNFGFPSANYVCQEMDDRDKDMNIYQILWINGQYKHGLSLKYMASIIEVNGEVEVVENENISNSESGDARITRNRVIKSDYVIFDVLQVNEEMQWMFQSVDRRKIKHYELAMGATQDASVSNNALDSHFDYQTNLKPMHISIFLKDLGIHGCNNRLLRFGCTICKYPEKYNFASVEYILGESTAQLEMGDLNVLKELKQCNCSIYSNRVLQMDFSVRQSEAITRWVGLKRKEDSTVNRNLDDSTGMQHLYDNDLLLRLINSDVLVIPNTHGDIQTHHLLQYVDYMRTGGGRCGAHSPYRVPVSPVVVLDLCNIYGFSDEYQYLWQTVIDGLLAPSLFMASHPHSIASEKPIEVAYPPCGEIEALNCIIGEEVYRSNECNRYVSDDEELEFHIRAGSADSFDGVLKWPRKINKKWRIGYFGRVSFERSPGLFIRTVAELIRIHTNPYNHSIELDMEFIVAGKGPALGYMKELANILGVSSYIQFLGYVPDMLHELRRADIVVNPMARVCLCDVSVLRVHAVSYRCLSTVDACRVKILA